MAFASSSWPVSTEQARKDEEHTIASAIQNSFGLTSTGQTSRAPRILTSRVVWPVCTELIEHRNVLRAQEALWACALGDSVALTLGPIRDTTTHVPALSACFFLVAEVCHEPLSPKGLLC
jgi:hypothetical protein